MWFEELAGFREGSVADVAAAFDLDGEYLTSRANGRRMRWGRFEAPTLGDLRRRAAGATRGREPLTCREVVADVGALHADPANAGALFQAASQFNALEMASPHLTPADGIDGYEHDHTQGPACAIACGAGTIYRNYFVPVGGGTGQSRSRQLNCLADLAGALRVDVEVRNGYAFPTASQLAAVGADLDGAGTQRREALMGHLRIGLQWGTEVTRPAAGHTVTQAYCAALPIAYTPIPAPQWEPLARLVLDATYEATLCAAVLNARETGNRTAFVTLVGAGAFGNPTDWVVDALGRAIGLFAGTGLDVAIVSYGGPARAVRRLLGPGRPDVGTRGGPAHAAVMGRGALTGLLPGGFVAPPLPSDLRPVPGTAPAGRDVVLGCLLGGAIGDVMGHPNEGGRGSTRFEDLDPRLAAISDDTQLTIEVAANLRDHGRFEPVRFAAQLVAWLPRAVGEGAATRRAVLRLQRGQAWYEAGEPSAGNGAAMRAAPFGLLLGHDPEAMLLDATACAATTHRDATAVSSTVITAWLVAALAATPFGGLDVDDLFGRLDRLAAALPDPPNRSRDPRRTAAVTLQGELRGVHDALGTPPARFFRERYSGAFVTESLPAAIWSFARAPDDPLEALRRPAELARDADTVAAIAGNLVGAYVGASRLPAPLTRLLPPDVVAAVEGLSTPRG